MSTDPAQLEKIKELFIKLNKARSWSLEYPQEQYPDKWTDKLLPMLESLYGQLEDLGVWRNFSMGCFCFGIDYVEAIKAWNAPDRIPKPPVVVDAFQLGF